MAPHFLAEKITCPSCRKPFGNLPGYAFSSWFLPIRCRECGSAIYMGYGPLTYVFVWFFAVPAAGFAILIASMHLFPRPLLVPGMILLFLPFPFLTILFAVPRLKKTGNRGGSLFQKGNARSGRDEESNR